MKSRKLMCVASLALFAAVPIASASTKWYVDGKHGNDNNNNNQRLHDRTPILCITGCAVAADAARVERPSQRGLCPYAQRSS